MNKKKIILTFVITLVIVLIVGCAVAAFILTRDNEVIKIKAEDISENTLVVNDEGTIQSALVEDFAKDYYDIDELTDFVKEDLDNYNKANKTNISLVEAKSNNGKAVLVFDYDSIDEYSSYNGIKAKVFNAKEALKDERVPSNLIKNGEDGVVPKDRVYENEKYITVVVDGDTEIIVNGKIKYYSGCDIIGEGRVLAKTGERAVVVFK
ncbi:MAG: hypothetical protein IJD02_06165 [Lachnospiraceae bacterium]|nr:hypothetical protein [Lachnospiraceae bacterium]